jgi:hypothetical protein
MDDVVLVDGDGDDCVLLDGLVHSLGFDVEHVDGASCCAYELSGDLSGDCD